MESTTRDRGTDAERSVGELVQRLSRRTSMLIRREMRVAQVEPHEKGRRAGIFGGAAVVALYGVGAPGADRRRRGRGGSPGALGRQKEA